MLPVKLAYLHLPVIVLSIMEIHLSESLRFLGDYQPASRMASSAGNILQQPRPRVPRELQAERRPIDIENDDAYKTESMEYHRQVLRSRLEEEEEEEGGVWLVFQIQGHKEVRQVL